MDMKRSLTFPAFLFLTTLFASPLHAGSEDSNHFAGNLLFTGLTYHPGGGEHENYPRKLDNAAYWVLQVGGQGDLDWYLHRYVLMRGSVALFRDCEDVWSGFFHLGPRLNLPIGPKFVFRIGIGPTLIWRQTWYGVDSTYHGDSFYGRDSTTTFQSRFLWYGGNLDFEWKLGPHFSLLYSNLPGWPHVVTNSIGARYSF